MKKVLEDLYFGEIRPNVPSYDESAQFKKCLSTIVENEDILFKLLEGKERKLFLDLVNAQSEVDGTSSVNNFIYGFKLGARIMVESLIEV